MEFLPTTDQLPIQAEDPLDDLTNQFQNLNIGPKPTSGPAQPSKGDIDPTPTQKTPLYKVGVVTNEEMLSHWCDYENQENHPENPERLRFVLDFLAKKKIHEITDFVTFYELCDKTYINLGYHKYIGP